MTTNASITRAGTLDLTKLGAGAMAGALAGAVSGIWARVAMRIIALASGQTPSFSIGGTLFILFFVALFLGLPAGMVYQVVRHRLPFRGILRAVVYSLLLLVVLTALAALLASDADEFDGIDALVAIGAFLPSPLIYGAVLSPALDRLHPAAKEERPVAIGWIIAVVITGIASLSGIVSLATRSSAFPAVMVHMYSGLGVPFVAARTLHTALVVLAGLAYVVLAIAILWRGVHSIMARAATVSLLAFSAALFSAHPPLPGALNRSLGEVVLILLRTVSLAGLPLLLAHLPDRRATTRWIWPTVAVWAAGIALWQFDLVAMPDVLRPARWPDLALAGFVLAGWLAGVASLFVRARREGSPALKTIRLGALVAVAAFGVLWFLSLRPGSVQTEGLVTFGPFIVVWLALPLSIWIAMRRNGLWFEGVSS